MYWSNFVKKFYWSAPVVTVYAAICLMVMIVYTALPEDLARGMMTWFRLPSHDYLEVIEKSKEFLLKDASFDYLELRKYLSFLTNAFGHANWGHFNGNLALLILVGMQTEQHYGSLRVFALAIFTALAISIIQFFFVGVALIGASGVIFLLIALSFFADYDDERIPVESIFLGIYFVGREAIRSFSGDEVSQLAHLIGLVIGIVYGYLFSNGVAKKIRG